MIPPDKPPIDAPIKSSSEDVLARAEIAHEFAESIRELDSSQGLVVGVLGPWGHGKSSFINLMLEQFDTEPPLTVVDFNPWLFSGSDQLVNFFLTEIAAQLNVHNEKRFGKAADWLAEYAGILKPISKFIPLPGSGLTAELVTEILAGLSSTTNANHSATVIREKITTELSALRDPVIVVIDDIDRLTTVEIREIFKLVRLTASFPNIVYVLAFDRERVERALSEDGIPGREYLEKIVQVSFDVPQAPGKYLHLEILEELSKIVAPISNVTLDEDRWGSAYDEVIRPLFATMRDVTRFAVSARSIIRSLGDQIDLVDLLAMEVVRIFRPGLMQWLSGCRSELTSRGSFMGHVDERAQRKIDTLFKSFPNDDELIRGLFRSVFPAALKYLENGDHGRDYGDDVIGSWRAARRMAHIDYLSLYFDRVAPDTLVTFRNSETAIELMSNGELLENYLSGLEPEILEDVIVGLGAFREKYTVDMIVPGSITLLNLIDAMPKKKPRSILDFGGRQIIVARITMRLLQLVEVEAEREKLVSQIIRGVETYSSQLDYILSVGHREGIGHELVSKSFAERLQNEFVKRLHRVPPADPAREWDAWRIYDAAQTATGDAPLAPSDDPVLLLAVVRSLRSTSHSTVLGSRQFRSEEVLAWDLLIELFGSEDVVKEVVNSIRTELGDDDSLRLVDKYLAGWRPDRFPLT